MIFSFFQHVWKVLAEELAEFKKLWKKEPAKAKYHADELARRKTLRDSRRQETMEK